MVTQKKFEPKIIKRITFPTLKLVSGVRLYVKIVNAIIKIDKGETDKGRKRTSGIFNVVHMETGEEMQFSPGAKVQAAIVGNYPSDAYVGKCFSILKIKTAGEGDGRGYTSFDISEIAAVSQ